MSLIDTLIEQLNKGSRPARIALAAESASRVYPIYENYWVGEFYESVGRSVDIIWSYACGATIEEGELRAYARQVREILDFYGEEEINILIRTVSVILYSLESLTDDNSASTLAGARSLAVARDVAQSAEAMTNQLQPKASRTQWAASWEEQWQHHALSIIDGWKGLARRDMFDPLDDKPPKWVVEWKAHRRPGGALRKARTER
jgi:hypothetical protein